MESSGKEPHTGGPVRPRRIMVDRELADHPVSRAVVARAGAPVTEVRGREELEEAARAGDFAASLNRGKGILHLTANRGRFLKDCPATRAYRCCGYQVLNIGMNCPLDCTYCILQAYLNNPWLSFFVNTEDLETELDRALAGGGTRRVGTGEFTDSLVLDHLTGLSTLLIKKFREHENGLLELKTKTANIENLLTVDPEGRCLVSWSLNAEEVANREELRTAGIGERLAAARTLAENGYHLGFHFDPVIHHPGWEEGYRRAIDRLFAAVPAERIVWISIGAFRFLPELKRIATRRFPGSEIYYDEFVTGLDGKERYFRSLREELYDLVAGRIRKHAHPRTCVYFCMESDEIWRRIMGFSPEERGGLAAMLDAAAARALADG